MSLLRRKSEKNNFWGTFPYKSGIFGKFSYKMPFYFSAHYCVLKVLGLVKISEILEIWFLSVFHVGEHEKVVFKLYLCQCVVRCLLSVVRRPFSGVRSFLLAR